jgi:transketolase
MTLTMGKALRVAMGEAITEAANHNDKIVVLDGDTGSSTRTDIFEAAHRDRFFQVGIAEMNMFGMAAGMATVDGLIPVVSTFSAFVVSRAHDAIRVLIAQPKANVKIMAGYAGLLASSTGKTHLLFDDVSIMRAMAYMTVIAPGDEIETHAAINAGFEYNGPIYYRLTRSDSPLLFDEDYKFEIGKTVTLREGTDVTLFSSGPHSTRALEAADILADEGIDVHLVHVPTIKPLNGDEVVAAAKKTGLVVTTEEGTVIGGLGGAIVEVLSQRAPMPAKLHGINDTYGESGPDAALLEKYGLTPQHIAAVVRDHVAANK